MQACVCTTPAGRAGTAECTARPCSKGVALRGLQSALRSRKSRLAGLPPGWFKKVQEEEKGGEDRQGRPRAGRLPVAALPRLVQDWRRVCLGRSCSSRGRRGQDQGARALISALNPDGAVSVGGASKSRRRSRGDGQKQQRPGSGASSAAPVVAEAKKLWCPALGCGPCEMILIIGGTRCAVCKRPSTCTANGRRLLTSPLVLCNSRRDGLSARPGSIDGDAMWLPAFALSPPPPPASGDDASDLGRRFPRPCGPSASPRPSRAARTRCRTTATRCPKMTWTRRWPQSTTGDGRQEHVLGR